MIDSKVFDLNMARLSEIDGALHDRLRQIESPVTRLTGADHGGKLNLDLGHTIFYEPDAKDYVSAQIKDFTQAPRRITAHLPPINHTGPFITDRFYGEFYSALKLGPESLISDADDRTGGFLIVLGVGLGGHIRPLTEAYEVRHVLIVEQMIEFIWHSFHIEDWTIWMNRIIDAGGTIKFITAASAEEVPNHLYWYLRDRDLELIAGSLIFKHYSSPYLDTVERLFRERLPLISVSAGFFEDELVMLGNNYRNFASHDYFLLEPKARPAVPVPAIIVGAGPSIDRAIEKIRALSGTAVVISCGTALGVLLRNGIVPDIQCELENVAAVWDHHSRLACSHDLSGITLVASCTVDPRIAALFERRIFFFRDALSSTQVFGNGFTELSGAAPSVTNLGLRLSRTLGFQEIFLFGVDMGSRNPANHHSKDAIYCTDEEWSRNYARNAEGMSIPLAGNFGGTVYTNRVLLWFRMMMADFLLMTPDLTVWNCSDGALVPGATPRLPTQVAPIPSAFDKQTWLEEIELYLRHYRAGDLIDQQMIANVFDHFRDWYRDLAAKLHVLEDTGSITDVYDEVIAHLDSAADYHPALDIINRGTFQLIFQFVLNLKRHLPATEHDRLRQEFLPLFSKVSGEMGERLFALHESLQNVDPVYP